MVLVSLIGEQPAPNLLPTRHMQPECSILVCTKRTEEIAKRLANVLKPICACETCCVEGYNIMEIQEALARHIDQRHPELPLTFNLTGGTKPMSLAAFILAQARSAPILYFQSEGNRSRLLAYRWRGTMVELVEDSELKQTISLADYLDLYLGTYEGGLPRDNFEQEVYNVLTTIPELECFTSVKPQKLGALEIDFVLRYGNQVAVGEAKRKAAKEGIDQINAVATPYYFGTYIHKFLFSGRVLDRNNAALAKAYKIAVVELPSYGHDGTLNPEDKSTLVEAVLGRLRR